LPLSAAGVGYIIQFQRISLERWLYLLCTA